ncbi:MAG TPA: hypothetical protein VGL61_27815 [Kofleriaceae bacterium]|jgi:hypothetical protein
MDQTAENEKATLVVPMVDPEIVTHLRALHALGWGKKRIARNDSPRPVLTIAGRRVALAR